MSIDENGEVSSEIARETTDDGTRCPICNKLLVDCKCVRVINVNAQKSEKNSDEGLRQRLDEREAQLAAIALKAFDDEKTKVLGAIKDPSRKEAVEREIGEDPAKLEALKLNLIASGEYESEEDDGTEKVPPSGKARAPKPDEWKQTGKVSPEREAIKQLYATITDPSKTVQEKREANKALDDVFQSVREGLKQRPKGSRYQFPTGVVMKCPSCGEIVETDIDESPCPFCGYQAGKSPSPSHPYY